MYIFWQYQFDSQNKRRRDVKKSLRTELPKYAGRLLKNLQLRLNYLCSGYNNLHFELILPSVPKVRYQVIEHLCAYKFAAFLRPRQQSAFILRHTGLCVLARAILFTGMC